VAAQSDINGYPPSLSLSLSVYIKKNEDTHKQAAQSLTISAKEIPLNHPNHETTMKRGKLLYPTGTVS
jgi:hypothetical protein